MAKTRDSEKTVRDRAIASSTFPGMVCLPCHSTTGLTVSGRIDADAVADPSAVESIQ
jgi:hypothetical protein